MLAQDVMHEMPPPVRRVPRGVWRDGSMYFGERSLAEEVPVAIAYDGATYAVLMATPSDLEDFALGFTCTEGIIAARGEITELRLICVLEGIVLQIWLSKDRSIALAARRPSPDRPRRMRLGRSQSRGTDIDLHPAGKSA
jgi:FdhD protein